MPLRVNFNVLNQKGTPAFFSDIFANRPAAGFAGRVFISTDTGAIYEDTGSAWTLIADAGAGTTGTLQQVTTNGNTTTQGISITAGGLSSNTVNVNGNGTTTGGSLSIKQYATAPTNVTGYNSISSQTSGHYFSASQGGSFKNFLFDPSSLTDVTLRQYTMPNASGTLALTSDLTTGYVPYTGATTNLNLGTNNISSFGANINGNGTTTGGTINFKIGSSGASGGSVGYTSLFAIGDNSFAINFGTLGKGIYFNSTLIANSTSYSYYFAPYTGVLAMGSLALTGYSSNPNTQFANAQFYSGLDSPAESHSFNIGIAGTAKANASVSTQWGVGVYGAGYTNGSTRSAGVEGDGEVTNSTDGGSAIGVRGYATATHSGGLNIGMLADASGSSTGNYGYYTNMAAAANTYANYHLGTAISYFGGKIGVGTNSPNALLDINGGDIYIRTGGVLATNTIDSYNTTLTIKSNGSNAIYIPATQNVLIGTTTDNGVKLQVDGQSYNTGLIATSNGSPQSLAYVGIPSIDNSLFTLSGTFPNVNFTSAFVSLRLQIVMSDGNSNNVTSSIINCVRTAATSWSYTIVNSVSLGTVFTPVLNFGGTNASPTLQITGAFFKSIIAEVITRQ